jgi:hypothetical protein
MLAPRYLSSSARKEISFSAVVAGRLERAFGTVRLFQLHLSQQLNLNYLILRWMKLMLGALR